MPKQTPAAVLDLQSPAASLQTFLEETLSGAPLFIFFVASKEPTTSQPWCPDVRKAAPIVDKFFDEHEQKLNFLTVEVGLKPEWRAADNVFRTEWGLQAIPTLAKYYIMDLEGEKIVAIRMLVEAECCEVEKLQGLVEDDPM
ncbi:hypothetical protein H072_6618 [Dactylellina haptotyla CBS 200.50]|uniref:Thioredoxin domain-containing protein n=1 Tax=Dactylellina haptotyla (strain CBS 200.50) TaxID=1284197 RepID=S8A9J9_DACHA|nr:hypothetical protein H072_6618 [Dactylellina haptotyla CBS 200.50]